MNFKDTIGNELSPGDFVAYSGHNNLHLCIVASIYTPKSGKWNPSRVKLKMLSVSEDQEDELNRYIYNTDSNRSVVKILPEGIPFNLRMRLEKAKSIWEKE